MTTKQALSYTSALVSPIGVSGVLPADPGAPVRCLIRRNPLTDLETTSGNA